jgi:hypothetical protein
MKLRGIAVVYIKSHIGETQVLELRAHMLEDSLNVRIEATMPVELPGYPN